MSSHVEPNPFDWHMFTGEYEKAFYDLRFPNGTIYKQLWPNAGGFTIPAELRAFKRPLRLDAKDKFEIRLSKLDIMGTEQLID